MRAAIEANGGEVFKTVGDAFNATFTEAGSALTAALQAQGSLQAHEWGEVGKLKVRMAIHTGTAETRDGDYFGRTLNRVARLLSVGHGGQILVSLVSAELLQDQLPEGVSLRDMGERKLKDLARLERVFQVVSPHLSSDFPALHTLESYSNNLPLQLTSFIGREQDLSELKEQLSRNRLITLIGSGGAGKTRLSIQLGAEVIGNFRDGVWLVELAPLQDPTSIPQMVAGILSIKEEAGRPLQNSISEYLKTRELLLILDNCEHLTISVAKFSGELLKLSPNLKIVATSREVLGILGEVTWRIPSLSVPDITKLKAQNPLKFETLLGYEAIRLFGERAEAVKPDFKLSEQNIEAVARICYRLDGIPLAIELAAARIRVLGAEQIAERLNERFKLLTGGNRAGLPRQQTLKAAVDWSYELLTHQEQLLWQRLSVFWGEWNMEGAVAICSGGELEEFEVLDLIYQLVEKSIVIVEKSEYSDNNYRMLETLKEYGWEKLEQEARGQEVQELHARYFLALAITLGQKLERYDQKADKLLGREYNNIRQAITWAILHHQTELAIRLAGAMGFYWELKGMSSEGLDLLNKALNLPEENPKTEERGNALYWATVFARYLSKFEESRNFAEKSLVLFTALNNKKGISNSIHNLGILAAVQGKYNEAADYFNEALVIRREIEDKVTEFYRDLFNELGISPARLTYEDISNFPLTTKEALKKYPDRFVNQNTTPFLRAMTTGTTATPTNICFSEYELSVYAKLAAISYLSNGEITQKDIVQLNTSARGLLGNLTLAGGCARIGAQVYLAGIIDPNKSLQLLAEKRELPGKCTRTSVLYTYPSYLGGLVTEGLRLGYTPQDFGLRNIIVGGEIVTSGLKKRANSLYAAYLIAAYP